MNGACEASGNLSNNYPLTPALSPWEREQNELPLGILNHDSSFSIVASLAFPSRSNRKHNYCDLKVLQPTFTIGAAAPSVSLSLGERAGVRGKISVRPLAFFNSEASSVPTR